MLPLTDSLISLSRTAFEGHFFFFLFSYVTMILAIVMYIALVDLHCLPGNGARSFWNTSCTTHHAACITPEATPETGSDIIPILHEC